MVAAQELSDALRQSYFHPPEPPVPAGFSPEQGLGAAGYPTGALERAQAHPSALLVQFEQLCFVQL